MFLDAAACPECPTVCPLSLPCLESRSKTLKNLRWRDTWRIHPSDWKTSVLLDSLASVADPGQIAVNHQSINHHHHSHHHHYTPDDSLHASILVWEVANIVHIGETTGQLPEINLTWSKKLLMKMNNKHKEKMMHKSRSWCTRMPICENRTLRSWCDAGQEAVGDHIRLKLRELIWELDIWKGSWPAYMGAERGRSIIGSFLRFLLSTFSFEGFLIKIQKIPSETHRRSWCHWLLLWVSGYDDIHLGNNDDDHNYLDIGNLDKSWLFTIGVIYFR